MQRDGVYVRSSTIHLRSPFFEPDKNRIRIRNRTRFGLDFLIWVDEAHLMVIR